MRYGLIAGNGKFPFLVAEGAKRAGASLAVVAIHEETDPAIEKFSDSLTWVGIGQLGKMIRFLKEQGVEKAMMAGQVKHVQIFSRAVPDARMLKVLLKLPRRNTDALIGAVADELRTEGIELVDSTFFLKDYLAQPGTLTRREPEQREREDIEYGLEVAHEIARLDLGQTIVVRARACVAIEAMEGTDATIRRAGELTHSLPNEEKKRSLGSIATSLIRGKRPELHSGRLTVVKIAKPDQDMRFDVPVVGLSTVEAMIDSGATCLCITAQKTLMFDRDELIRLADENSIAITAV
jgi:UDP-2,3-diacylglucosamine hydrolase